MSLYCPTLPLRFNTSFLSCMKMPAGIALQFSLHVCAALPMERTLQQGGAKGIGPLLIELVVPGVTRELSWSQYH